MRHMLDDVFAPLLRRSATGATAYLIGFGVAEQSAEVIALGLVTSVFVVGELILSKLNRRK